MISKYNLLFYYCDAKEISFYYLHYTKFVQNMKKQVNSTYIVGIIFVRYINEWCLVDCFHHRFVASTQIIVCNWFSDVFRGYRKATLGCNGYMTLGAIFLQFKIFTIIWTLLLLFTCLLKKPYFSIFHTKYLIIISPHLRPLAKLGCQ